MDEGSSIKKQYDEVINQLSDPELISDWERFEELGKKKAYLEKVIEKESEIQEIDNKIQENQSIMATEAESELYSLAETEVSELKKKKDDLQKELEELKKSNAKASEAAAVVIEIRAGTGGEEAALFAADLYRMYTRYAQLKGWKQKTLDSNRTEIGGFKEIIFELKNPHAWEEMKNEAGVHRIQRIPETEKSGRIHTSTASVAVLPKAKKGESRLKPDELKIDFFCSSGPGGQYVNKRESAVRITHLPTGLVVASQTERNQLANKENALELLQYRLQEKREKEEEARMGGKRKDQIGAAKRAEKIRTYNVPQDRVTDHRIKKNWHDLESIFNGNIQHIVDTLKEMEEE